MKTLMAAAVCLYGLVLILLPASAQADGDKLVHKVRFSDYETGTVESWLQSKGFTFNDNARRRDLFQPSVDDNGLTLEAKQPTLGIMLNETVNVPEFSYVEIDWGINKFPQGASYEQGVRNEALMVIVFMGDERQPSGSFFIPDTPILLGFSCVMVTTD